MKAYKIVFENGLEVRNGEDGFWHFQSANPLVKIRAESLQEFAGKFNKRPILIGHKFAGGHKTSFLLPYTNNRKYLDIEHSEIIQGDWIRNNPNLHADGFNLSYITGAVVYHCKRLAETYSLICKDFSKFPTETKNQSEKALFGYQPEAYYEFDALITSARRAYDTTRYILWKAFGPGKGSIPSSFIKTFPKCTQLPGWLSNRLTESWSEFGLQITDYRDCIQHYVPLDFGISSAFMTLLDNKIWSVSMLLPDNPKEKSKKKLKYESRIDALTFGWTVASEIMDVANLIISALPDKGNTNLKG